MTDRDHELDEIIEPLRQVEHPEFLLASLKKQMNQNKKPHAQYNLLTIAISLAAGILIGLSISKLGAHKEIQRENIFANATKVERFNNID